MGFGKAVISEAFDLLETAFGKIPVVTVLKHTGDETLVELMDVSKAAEGGQCTPERICFLRRETGGGDSVEDAG